MKAMLIGGAGFVGKHLAIHLANTYGWEIVITGLPEEREAIERSSLGRFIPVNILEKGQIQAVLEQERPHYIFHLAAQSSVARSWKNPQATIDVNVKGCANLLDAIHSVEIYDPKILLIGSGDEYGRLPASCRSGKSPSVLQAVTALMGTRLVLQPDTFLKYTIRAIWQREWKSVRYSVQLRQATFAEKLRFQAMLSSCWAVRLDGTAAAVQLVLPSPIPLNRWNPAVQKYKRGTLRKNANYSGCSVTRMSPR